MRPSADRFIFPKYMRHKLVAFPDAAISLYIVPEFLQDIGDCICRKLQRELLEASAQVSTSGQHALEMPTAKELQTSSE